MPWTIVYPVLHTGFTVAYRDQHQGMLRHAEEGIVVNAHQLSLYYCCPYPSYCNSVPACLHSSQHL